MTQFVNFDIRYSYVTDVIYLKRWLSLPGMLHWFPMSEEEPKEVADAIQCWMGFCRYSACLTATVDNVPCGMGVLFLMPYRKVSHHALFKLIVDPDYQRKGIGTALVKNLKHLAKTYFNLEFLHIELFEGNPLAILLEKMGFRTIARQEGFVKEKEGYLTRLIMECDL